jgi:hypothetical protein
VHEDEQRPVGGAGLEIGDPVFLGFKEFGLGDGHPTTLTQQHLRFPPEPNMPVVAGGRTGQARRTDSHTSANADPRVARRCQQPALVRW